MKVSVNLKSLEPVSKPPITRTYLKNKIRVQGKARNSRKSGAYTSYVSILNRFATPPWALRLFLI
jgi:hypothetical protein